MGEIQIDAVLLRHLRTAGMADATIAVHGAGVLAHDARAQRAITEHCSGEATFEDDVVMCAVHLAHGIHWCGGQLRLNRAHRSLPSILEDALIGRPLGTVLSHPLLDPALTITGVRHDDTSRFAAGGGPEGDASVVIIETDAIPVAVSSTLKARMFAPWQRFLEDQMLCADEPGTRTKWDVRRMILLNTFWMTIMAAVTLSSVLRLHDVARIVGWTLVASLASAVVTVLMAKAGHSVRNDVGWANLYFRKSTRRRQEQEGMRD